MIRATFSPFGQSRQPPPRLFQQFIAISPRRWLSSRRCYEDANMSITPLFAIFSALHYFHHASRVYAIRVPYLPLVFFFFSLAFAEDIHIFSRHHFHADVYIDAMLLFMAKCHCHMLFFVTLYDVFPMPSFHSRHLPTPLIIIFADSSFDDHFAYISFRCCPPRRA